MFRNHCITWHAQPYALYVQVNALLRNSRKCPRERLLFKKSLNIIVVISSSVITV